MVRENTVFTEVAKILAAIGICRWATGNAYHTVAKVSTVSETTVNDLLLQFCTVFCMIFPHNIKYPITKEKTSMMIDWFNLWTNCSTPQAVGCLDSTHCAIAFLDSDSKVDYFNGKKLTQSTLKLLWVKD